MRITHAIRYNTRFVVSILTSAFFIATGIISATADESVVDNHAEKIAYLKSLSSPESKLEIWWCRPLDAYWSQYEFHQITGADEKNIILGLANSELSLDAGNYYTLDMPIELADSRGQGVLVVRDLGRKKLFGFRFRAITVDKHALQFANVSVFDPEKESLNYSHGDFAGVTMKTDFRSVLAEARRAERAPAVEPKMPNKAEIATPRKPSD